MPKQRLIYLAMLLGAAAFYLFYWDYVAFAGLVLVAVLPLLSYLILLFSSLFIRVRLSAAVPAANQGAPAVLRLELMNRGLFAITAAQVSVTLSNLFTGELSKERIVLPIGASNVTMLELDVISSHCGVVEAVVERVRLFDFFCILSISIKSGVRGEVTILPELLETEAKPVHSPGEAGECQSYSTEKPGDDPSQIFDFHEYRDGDRLKSIHWKLSARMDALLVKEYSLPLASDACIVWELFARPQSLGQADLLAEACASLSLFLSKNGIPHTVEWFSQKSKRAEKENIGPGADPIDALTRIFTAGRADSPRMLAELLGQPGAPVFAKLIYMTAALTEENTRQLLLLREAVPVYVLYAAPPKAVDSIFMEELSAGSVPVTVLGEGLYFEEFLEQVF